MTKTPRMATQVAALTFARLTHNISHRMIYPFLPIIAQGLNISLPAAGRLLALRSAVGLLSPLLGSLSDRLGRRRMMTAGMLILIGATLLILLPHHSAIVLGFALLGLAKVVFDPSLYAYLADRIPYHRRGRLIAVIELTWGGAILLGAPAMGWIIEWGGWQTSFAVLAGVALIALLALRLALPDDGRSSTTMAATPFRLALRSVMSNRAAVAMLGIACLMATASELLFIVYGGWLKSGFGLSVSRLGLATAVIGAAEILGEIGVGGWVDRWGKRRSVAIGLFLTAIAFVVLPLVSTGLTATLLALFVLVLCFEFTVVALLPLVTELVPAARATMMALNVAALSLGRMIGASSGPLLWDMGGLNWNSMTAALGVLLALGLLLAFVREESTSPPGEAGGPA